MKTLYKSNRLLISFDDACVPASYLAGRHVASNQGVTYLDVLEVADWHERYALRLPAGEKDDLHARFGAMLHRVASRVPEDFEGEIQVSTC